MKTINFKDRSSSFEARKDFCLRIVACRRQPGRLSGGMLMVLLGGIFVTVTVVALVRGGFSSMATSTKGLSVPNRTKSHLVFNSTVVSSSSPLLVDSPTHQPLTDPSSECVDDKERIRKECRAHVCVNPAVSVGAEKEEKERSNYDSRRKSSPLLLASDSSCKMLWFAGMSLGPNSECKGSENDEDGGGGYRMEYAVALQSARLHAADTLQPVLLLGRWGLDKQTELPKIALWARDQGAIVIFVDELSFQAEVVERWHVGNDRDHQMGPYLRVDLAKIVHEHDLMNNTDSNNGHGGGVICDRHVLYTDSDVVFVNPITHSDLEYLKSRISPQKDPYILYGRQQDPSYLTPSNTGVVLMDVYRFADDWPDFYLYGRKEGPFLSFDQGWFNSFYSSSRRRRKKRALLPLHWNWKAYWMLDDPPSDSFKKIKILHFHGPKPGRGLYDMAICSLIDSRTSGTNTSKQEQQLRLERIPKDYLPLVKNSMCCDTGRTAHHIWQMYRALRPPTQAIC